MGAEVVQVSGLCPMDSKELAKISADTNLPICITHASVDRIKNDLDQLAEEHLEFGCKNMGIAMMPWEYQKDVDGLKRFIALLNSTAEKLKKYAMTIGYHNHTFEFKRIGNRVIMDILIEDTIPDVEFIPDTCWIRAGGHKPEDYIEKMTGRINTIHLKDYKRSFFKHTPKAAGEGILDFKSILAAAIRHGAINSVVELDHHRDPFLALEKSLKNIRILC